MIKVKDREKAIRTIEAFHTFSVVLPIYDEEARSLFRASFKADMADLLPQFFQSLALESIKNESGFNQYVNYFNDLLKYVNGEIDEIPKPLNANDNYFLNVRYQAEKLLNAWNVK